MIFHWRKNNKSPQISKTLRSILQDSSKYSPKFFEIFSKTLRNILQDSSKYFPRLFEIFSLVSTMLYSGWLSFFFWFLVSLVSFLGFLEEFKRHQLQATSLSLSCFTAAFSAQSNYLTFRFLWFLLYGPLYRQKWASSLIVREINLRYLLY